MKTCSGLRNSIYTGIRCKSFIYRGIFRKNEFHLDKVVIYMGKIRQNSRDQPISLIYPGFPFIEAPLTKVRLYMKNLFIRYIFLIKLRLFCSFPIYGGKGCATWWRNFKTGRNEEKIPDSGWKRTDIFRFSDMIFYLFCDYLRKNAKYYYFEAFGPSPFG